MITIKRVFIARLNLILGILRGNEEEKIYCIKPQTIYIHSI